MTIKYKTFHAAIIETFNVPHESYYIHFIEILCAREVIDVVNKLEEKKSKGIEKYLKTCDLST